MKTRAFDEFRVNLFWLKKKMRNVQAIFYLKT